MPAEASLQQFVHNLERGKFSLIIKGAMFTALIAALILIYLFIHFAGLNSVTAMDQAQISRNIASGQGFTTSYIRPAAMWQLRSAEKATDVVDGTKMPEFFQSPLVPWVNAIPLLIAKNTWKIQPQDLVYGPDRLLAGVSMTFFLLSVIVWYLIATRLFDAKLGVLTAVLLLMTDFFWRFSLSALPQMFLLLLFSGAIFTTLLAQAAAAQENMVRQVIWLAVSGFLFGLMGLAHALTLWIFIGWILWVGIFLKPRVICVAVPLVVLLVVITPWLVYNYQVCGNPLGLGIRAAAASTPLEQDVFRSINGEFPNTTTVTNKLKTGIIKQIGNLVSFLGLNFVAGAFFFSLMHPFRNLRTASLRWGVVLMWIMAVIGMAIFGVDEAISVNQLHVLFIPIFVMYGLAFLLVLWSRLQVQEEILNKAFTGLIVLLTSVPLLLTVFSGPQNRIQWPPYLPPIIGALGQWFDEDEVICSDMPWAVAWYSQRKSLLLPESVRTFIQIHDFKQLGMDMPGLYLTPVTGNQALFSSIYKGSYKEWVYLITRPPQPKSFPLPVFMPLPVEGESIIYADRARWEESRP